MHKCQIANTVGEKGGRLNCKTREFAEHDELSEIMNRSRESVCIWCLWLIHWQYENRIKFPTFFPPHIYSSFLFIDFSTPVGFCKFPFLRILFRQKRFPSHRRERRKKTLKGKLCNFHGVFPSSAAKKENEVEP